jgi:hypothetical protein
MNSPHHVLMAERLVQMADQPFPQLRFCTPRPFHLARATLALWSSSHCGRMNNRLRRIYEHLDDTRHERANAAIGWQNGTCFEGGRYDRVCNRSSQGIFVIDHRRIAGKLEVEWLLEF